MLAARRDGGNERSSLAGRASACADPSKRPSLSFLPAKQIQDQPDPPWESFGGKDGWQEGACEEVRCQ